jgi:hypothetical protein
MSAAGIRDYATRNVIFGTDPFKLVRELTTILNRISKEERPTDELTQRL